MHLVNLRAFECEIHTDILLVMLQAVWKLSRYTCRVLTATADGSVHWTFREGPQWLESYPSSSPIFFHLIGGSLPHYFNTRASELSFHSETVYLKTRFFKLCQRVAKQLATAFLDGGGAAIAVVRFSMCTVRQRWAGRDPLSRKRNTTAQ